MGDKSIFKDKLRESVASVLPILVIVLGKYKLTTQND